MKKKKKARKKAKSNPLKKLVAEVETAGAVVEGVAETILKGDS